MKGKYFYRKYRDMIILVVGTILILGGIILWYALEPYIWQFTKWRAERNGLTIMEQIIADKPTGTR